MLCRYLHAVVSETSREAVGPECHPQVFRVIPGRKALEYKHPPRGSYPAFTELSAEAGRAACDLHHKLFTQNLKLKWFTLSREHSVIESLEHPAVLLISPLESVRNTAGRVLLPKRPGWPHYDMEFVLRTIPEDMTVIGHGPQISLVHMQQGHLPIAGTR